MLTVTKKSVSAKVEAVSSFGGGLLAGQPGMPVVQRDAP
jgi:hypothetical protein